MNRYLNLWIGTSVKKISLEFQVVPPPPIMGAVRKGYDYGGAYVISNQDPRWTQKTIYTPIFSHHIWSWLICTPLNGSFSRDKKPGKKGEWWVLPQPISCSLKPIRMWEGKWTWRQDTLRFGQLLPAAAPRGGDARARHGRGQAPFLFVPLREEHAR